MKRPGIPALAILFLMSICAALADATLRSGAVIVTQTADALDAQTIKTGDIIMLNVVEPYPQDGAALAGSAIIVRVTDVTSGGGRPRVAFAFDRIRFANGRTEPIAAYVQSSAVVRRDGASAAAPVSVQTAVPASAKPNTIFWSKKIGGSSTSSGASTGGYLYPRSGDARVPPGTTVRVELAKDLSIPQ